ncbi:MAG: LLM class flavin-dependent oxidoreductase [Trebonia sp.]
MIFIREYYVALPADDRGRVATIRIDLLEADSMSLTGPPRPGTRMRLRLALDLGSSADLRTQLARAESLCEAADEAGFESVWLGESYYRKAVPYHLPSSLIMLTHLATLTRLGLGTGVLLFRAYDPVKLAFDAAMVDQLSGGRLTLGIGLGGAGVSETLRKGRLPKDFFDDGLAALKQAWQPGAGAGAVATAPPPFQAGGPKLLIGGSGVRAAERAARFAAGYLAATSFSDQLLRVRARQYLERCEAGPGEVAVNRLCVVRENGGEARRLAREYMTPVSDLYERQGLWGAGPEMTADPSQGVVLAGTPQDVASRIAEYESWGVTRVHLRAAPVGMPAQDAAETMALISGELAG